MATLAACLKRAGSELSAHDKATIKSYVKEYRDEGYKPVEAATLGVNDFIDDVTAERQIVVDQIKAKVPDFATPVKAAIGGMDDILKGISAAFGVDSNKLITFPPNFDEEAYAKARPFFQAGWKKFEEAGRTLLEYVQYMVDALRSKVPNIGDHLTYFLGEMRGKNNYEEDVRNANEFSSRPNMERNPGPGDTVGKKDVQAGRGPDSGGRRQRVPTPQQTGGATPGNLFTPDLEAAAAGKRGDFSPYSEDQPAGSEVGPAGGDDSEPGGALGIGGEQIDADGAEGPAGSTGKLKQQRIAQGKAQSVPVKPGDRANIDASLPFLKTGQRDDVAFAEKRHAEPTGYGVMFTNGTGTGKTYSALGIIKRMERQGKTNILIVAPQDGIMQAFIAAGKNLQLGIKPLADTKSHGDSGIVITTYANLGQNDALARRKWDAVVTDEAHYLMQAADGKTTNALTALRAITMHPRGEYARYEMLNRDDINALDGLQKRISANEKIRNLDDTRDEERIALETENEGLQKQTDVLKGKLKAARAAVVADIQKSQGAGRTRVAFMSATPFAYEKTIDFAEGYLFDYPKVERGGYNIPDGYGKFMMDHFGYRMRYGKLTTPESEVDPGLMQRTFNSWLKKQGVLSGRMLDVDKDYDRKFILTESAIGTKIDDGLRYLFDNKRMTPLWSLVHEKFDHLTRRYLLEAIKAREVLPLIKDNLTLGRKVVVFHDFKKGGGFNPFDLSEYRNSASEIKVEGKKTTIGALVREYEAARPDLLNLPLKGLKSPIASITEAFPDALVFNGDVPKADRRAAIEQFQRDDSGRNLIVVQSAAGKEGISLHDMTGNMPRVLFNLGLPTQPTTAIQQEGRIFRVGQASNAMFRYLNTGTNWERWAFANTIAHRASAAENLALGEQARALLDAYIQGFEESDTYPAGHEGEGTGGKERDAATNSVLTDWDRATALYYAQAKKTARTKAAEGKDYFATPEPLGLKMVQWAGIRPGDRVLEPSAGHGAIARWFPENTDRTVVEPSMELAGRLKMVTDARLLNERFEDLHVGANKFDAIVMNPPFGTADRTAIDHLAKAAQHLRAGGRIVALIPRGSADDKFTKWYESDAADGIHMVGDIELPRVTFERAGTNVSARVVILDKTDKPDQKVAPAIVGDDIKEFFTRLEHISVPDRPSVASAGPQAAAVPPIEAGAFRLAQTTHAKKGIDLYVAALTSRVERDEYSRLNDLAKKNGGYYSAYKAQGAIPGFQFETDKDRTAFVDAATAETEGEYRTAIDTYNEKNGTNLRYDGPQKDMEGNVDFHLVTDTDPESPAYKATFAVEGMTTAGIRSAHDERVALFTTKEPDIRYRRIAGTTGNTRDDVVTVLADTKYGPYVKRLVDSGKLKIVQSADEVPGSADHNGMSGAYDPKADQMYIMADGTRKGDEVRVLLHEALHRARTLDSKGLAPILDELKKLHRLSMRPGSSVAGWFKQARAAAQVNIESPHYWEEIAAYATENTDKAPGLIRQWVDRYLAWAKAWVYRTFGKRIGALDPAMLREVAASALRAEGRVAAGDVRYSQKQVVEAAKALYSKLARVTEEKFQGMKAQGVVNFLSKHGVKREEMNAAGLTNWLAQKKPTDRVDRQELVDFVRANAIETEDVVLHDKAQIAPEVAREYHELDRMVALRQDFTPEQSDRYRELKYLIDDAKEGKKTHFSQYQEPGAEEGSYREMFVTVPKHWGMTKKEIEERNNLQSMLSNKNPYLTGHKEYDDLTKELRTLSVGDTGFEEKNKRFIELDRTVIKLLREGEAKLMERLELLKEKSNSGWQDGHSDYSTITNPVVRIRFNERTDVEGRKVMFVEEMQGPSKENQAKMPAYLRENIYQIGTKRALAYAKENGFDGVSWTPGQVQADRYDLSKQIDSIGYQKRGDNYNVTVWDKKGGQVWQNQSATPEDIEANLGKEVLKKMAGGEGNAPAPGKNLPTYLTGLDLKVGGEGLSRLYDTDLPKMFEAYGKGMVGETTFFMPQENRGDDFDAPFIPVTEQTPASYPLFRKNQGLYDTPEQKQALENVGGLPTPKTLKQWWAEFKPGLSLRFTQSVADQFASLKTLGHREYRLARQAKNTEGALEVLMKYGSLFLDDGAMNATKREEGGVIQSLQKLQGEQHRFFWWIAANRAEYLMDDERENLFQESDINTLKTLVDGTMSDGQDRRTVYDAVLKDYVQANKNVMDIAEQSGLIDGDTRSKWEHDMYVPFYRINEDNVGGKGISSGGGLVRQYAFKQLKGGTRKLNEDLMANVLQNWAHILSASAKNRAAAAVLPSAARDGVNAAELIGEHAESGKNVVWYMGRFKKVLTKGTKYTEAGGTTKISDGTHEVDVHGKIYYRVTDPLVLESITALEFNGFSGITMKTMRKFKNALTYGVTANPAFKVRNLMRDSIAAISQNEMSYNVVKNVVGGSKSIIARDQNYISALAGGGVIRFGTMLEGDSSRRVDKLVNAGVKVSTIIDTKEKMLDMLAKLADAYTEVGDVSEGANRLAQYKHLREQGYSHADAVFAAQDMMDFSLHGSSSAIRFLAQTVPFFNARVQGLYKMARAGKANPRRLGAVIGAYAIGSIALALFYRDDEDWKKREDWDRDNYTWFKIGGIAYRWPKPFEVGVIATLAERAVELMTSDEMTGERFAERLSAAIGQTLAFNPTPQILKPLVDLYSNTDSFTGRPIEGPSLENRLKPERFTSRTTAGAKFLGKAGGVTNISPVQIDHLIRGYFGWLGTSAATAVDYMARPTGRPAMQLRDVFLAGNFVETLPTNSSRYVTEFYKQAKEVQQAYTSVKTRVEEKNIPRAKAIAATQGGVAALQVKAAMSRKYQKALSDINNRLDEIESSDMSADAKRKWVNVLSAKKNALAKRYITQTRR